MINENLCDWWSRTASAEKFLLHLKISYSNWKWKGCEKGKEMPEKAMRKLQYLMFRILNQFRISNVSEYLLFAQFNYDVRFAVVLVPLWCVYALAIVVLARISSIEKNNQEFEWDEFHFSFRRARTGITPVENYEYVHTILSCLQKLLVILKYSTCLSLILFWP